MILNLISGPRNISTALMYSFAQRSDTLVRDEPFYAVYLSRTGAAHPGAEEVLRALPQDEMKVKEQLAAPRSEPVLFIKNMAHHLEVLDEPSIQDAVNIFLIRDPAQILASYAEVITQPVMRDIGIAYQCKLFEQLKSERRQPLVIDSGILLQDPQGVLTKICNHCGLAYEQRMAHWPAGPKAYDGVWAPYWYANVHRSTGFERQPTSSRPLPAHLIGLCDEARRFYENLLAFAVNA